MTPNQREHRVDGTGCGEQEEEDRRDRDRARDRREVERGAEEAAPAQHAGG